MILWLASLGCSGPGTELPKDTGTDTAPPLPPACELAPCITDVASASYSGTAADQAGTGYAMVSTDDTVWVGAPAASADGFLPRVLELSVPDLDVSAEWLGEQNDSTGRALAVADVGGDGNPAVAIGQPFAAVAVAAEVVVLEQGIGNRTLPEGAQSTFWTEEPSAVAGLALSAWRPDGGVEWLIEGNTKDGTNGRVYAIDATRTGALSETDAHRVVEDVESFFGELEPWAARGDGAPGFVMATFQGIHWMEPWEGTAGLSDASLVWTHPRAFQYDIGTRLRARGDLDGDGLIDLVVGAPTHEEPVFRAGRAYVLLGGGDDGPLDDVPVQVVGEEEGEALGYGVATGDVNGDGQDDLLLGAPGLQGEPRPGALHVFLGPITGRLTTSDADATVYGERAGDFFGREIVIVDADQDDRADVVVSASPFGGKGTVYLIRGADLPL